MYNEDDSTVSDAAVIEKENPAAEKPKGPVMAFGQDIKLAEHGSQRWRVRARTEHTPDDVKHAAYLWARAHTTGKNGIQPGDIIEVSHEQHGFYIELYCAAIDPSTHSVRCHVLTEKVFTKSALPLRDLSAATVEWKGGAKWSVILGHSVLSKNHATKEVAEAWLERKRAGQ